MIFRDNTPIYLQIQEYIENKILDSVFRESDKIESVRDLSAFMQVNPNTVLRAYEILQRENILEVRRGIGFVVKVGAREEVLRKRREEFLKAELPYFAKKAKALGFTLRDIEKYF